MIIAFSHTTNKCYPVIVTADGRARVDYFGSLEDLTIWEAHNIGHEGRVSLDKQRPDLRPDYT